MSQTARRLRSHITEHVELTPIARRLTIHEPAIAGSATPGQFVHVLCSSGRSLDPLLRRPFSVHDVDPAAGSVSILYEIVGRGTALLAEKRPGETLDLLGPLGEGFSLPTSSGRPILLIAGGIAVAPLHYLARRLAETMGVQRTTILIGARSECLLICVEQFREFGDVRIATDDGTAGHRGFVTGLLSECIEEMDEENLPLVFACGPMAMLRAVSRITNAHDLKTQVSTEALMACGVGACMSCAIKVRDGDGVKYVRCCKEGPMFYADEVVWE
jgi:dihydroorotate dehydrogenase electron transfer subunit